MMNRQDDGSYERSYERDDVSGNVNKEDGSRDAADTVDSVPAPGDPVTQLQVDLNAAKTEIAEWQDRFLRKAAEFENYRKRVEKEKSELRIQAQSAVLLELLPVVDACERALKIFEENKGEAADLSQYREGVELLYQQMLDAFKRTGAEIMDAQGKQFDPHLHEALSREVTADYEEGTIVRELRRGYLFKDRLLRPAQVIVAVHPPGQDAHG